MTKPKIGSIVLYCQDEKEYAAIITKIRDYSESIDITIFPPPMATNIGTGILTKNLVPPLSPGITSFCWKWPDA